MLRKQFVYLNEFTVCTVQTLNFKAKSIGLQTNTYLSGDRSIILPEIGSFFKYRVFFQVFQSFSRVGPQTLVVRTSLKRIQMKPFKHNGDKGFHVLNRGQSCKMFSRHFCPNGMKGTCNCRFEIMAKVFKLHIRSEG